MAKRTACCVNARLFTRAGLDEAVHTPCAQCFRPASRHGVRHPHAIPAGSYRDAPKGGVSAGSWRRGTPKRGPAQRTYGEGPTVRLWPRRRT
jgi:hypothetical protein